MTIGDFKRDSARRRKSAGAGEENVKSKNHADRGRKPGRGRLWLILLVGLGLFVAAAPSLVCYTPLAHSLFTAAVSKYAVEGSFQSARIGWVTPARITGVNLLGIEGGTRVRVDQLDCNATLLKIIGGLREPVSIAARGVVVEASVIDGWSSIDSDWAALQRSLEENQTEREPNDDESQSSFGPDQWSIDIQSLAVKVTDAVTGEVSMLDQAKAEATFRQSLLTGGISAVLSEAKTGSGQLEATLSCDTHGDSGLTLGAKFQGLPLRVVLLAKRRFPVEAASVPEQISGDLSGEVQVVGGTTTATGQAIWSFDAKPLELRNVSASGTGLGQQVWRNSLMTISGRAIVDPEGVHGEQLQLTTDFAELALNGDFVPPTDPIQMANPIAWLTALDGTAKGFVNLPMMVQRLPGALPLKPETEILNGIFHAEITSRPEANAARIVNANLRSDPIVARAAGRNVVLEPANVVAAIGVDAAGHWTANQCQIKSAFGTATLDGDLANGRAQANIDLGRLAAMLEPLVDLPDLELAGVAAAELQWSAQAGQLWRLRGDGNATELTISLPGGLQFHRPNMSFQADAAGQWSAGELQELTAAELSIRSESIEIDASLIASVAKPSAQTLWPLRVNGRGRMEVLAQFLGPWMPESMHSLAGGFVGNADLVVGLISGEINGASLKVVQPRLGWDDRLLTQSEIAIDFDGQYAWPSGVLRARSITVAGESISGAAKGLMTEEAVDLEVAFRADLGRLQGAFVPRLSQDQTKFGQTRFASAPVASTNTASHWVYQGTCEGNLRATRDAANDGLTIEARSKGRNLAIGQRVGTENNKSRPNEAIAANELVWAEPNAQLDGLIVYHPADGAIDARRLAITTDWVSTKLDGRVVPGDKQTDVKLAGKATMRMEEVAKQLSTLAGLPIILQGIHDTTIDIAATQRQDSSVALSLTTNLGWESGEVAGVVFGPSTIPVTMTETTVAIRQAVIPVDQGRITASADIHYYPGPLWMDVKPGVIAQNLRMTPQLSDRWLQYLAPMVAQATRIDGTFGVELSQAEVNLVDPLQSRVRGQLQINQVNFDAGPVTTQLLSSVQQIQMLARGRTADAAAPQDRVRTLAVLPTQTVDFDFTNGLITHQRLFMTVDKARIITSGQVHVDGNLNLVTQVPLDAEWLGSDLKALAGTTVTLPITGTLSRPRLDPTAIRSLVGQIGTQAIQSQAENYLEKQLNRGLERLLGK